MPMVAFDDSGKEYEAIASALTLMIYEQEFSTEKRHADLIKDVFGRIDLTDGGNREVVTAEFVTNKLQGAMAQGKTLPKTTRDLILKAFPAYVDTTLDYTQDNWTAYVRALWAMVKTADHVRMAKDPDAAPQLPPTFAGWMEQAGAIDMNAITSFVVGQCSTAFFRA